MPKLIHKHLFKIANISVDDIVEGFRILRRINAADTLELTLVTDEQMGYLAGQAISIELHSDTDIYRASFIIDTLEKDGNTLTLVAYSALTPKTKTDYYALAEDSHILATRLGAAADALISYPVSLSCEKMTKLDALVELASITGAEVYENSEALYISDAAIIEDTATIATALHERRDILSLELSITPPNTKTIEVNIAENESIYAKPALMLAIDHDPHPVTPISPIVYTKDTQSYTISPLRGRAILYYSPITKEPTIVSCIPFVKRSGYKIVEKFTLEGDHSVTLVGGISNIIDIELDGVDFGGYTYQSGHNVLAWNEAATGELKISYASDVYYAQMPPSSAPTTLKIKAAHENLYIEHSYRYDYGGYYPLPFRISLSLIVDFGLESDDAVNAVVEVRKAGVVTQTTPADAFGELEIGFEAYGFYRLTAAGVTRYVTIFANEYNLSVDKPQGAVC